MTFNPDGPNTHTNNPIDDDPFASAGAATLRPRDYYGQLSVDAWYCKLVKGQGKVPWDKNADSIDSRVTALTLELQPVADSGLSFTLRREMIAESVEWVKICWPSMRECGVQSVKSANGIWCRLVQEPTGRKYRSSRTGMEQEATTFKVLEVYPDQQSCEAAYKAAHGESAVEEIEGVDFDGNGHKAQPKPTTPPFMADPAPADDARKRETARQFLLAIAKQKQGDLEAVKAVVAAMPMITEYFAADSPEFMSVVAEAL